ncbi:heat shock protein hsp-12.2-related [Holotrichia oblita]|uniref:Heat shock protein hsp-12.2-related n=1 Tax=Holotrichia oblita TaxID=644536 RepID=A0ACB9T3Z5_HOLOL|nr:heat shock protein hsp-12.2-related [Holotrichia oblita]
MFLLPLMFDNLCSVKPCNSSNGNFKIRLSGSELLMPLLMPHDFGELVRISSFDYKPFKSKDKEIDSEIVDNGNEKFLVKLNIPEFSPDEITVKVTGEDSITVEGKHEEKQDKYGYISRHLVRKFILPNGCDSENIQSTLSSDGVLTITAPKTTIGEVEARTVPIEQTGIPSNDL